MNMHHRSLALTIYTLLALGVSAAPASLAAQGSGTTPIFLALPDEYPNVDGRVLLLREPSREIVVVAQTATPEDLTVALRMLERFRRERGQPTAGRGQMIPIVGYAPDPVLEMVERTRLDAALADLKARPFANVGNLGRGRWMRYDVR